MITWRKLSIDRRRVGSCFAPFPFHLGTEGWPKMMLSPQLFHVTTALALLLVTSYAEKECIGICGKGNQGTKGLPLSFGTKLQETLQPLF
ncbi:hypothetical protein Y1Q_0005247 [Alligator mississippiensis]|uniref:Uncharacterized protein n=1 Tax=Alligator mississippiensis TaxID=8496 RepID=A0A151MT54_ALLMI|nr:hypothetical protein Y1Q_0005247 [Alligator mississippiensis]